MKVTAMSKLGTNASVRTVSTQDGASPSDHLVRAFNESRDEIVSTLCFILGNREDARDAAQEAFLKCWRAQASLKEVRNMRAWIFRVAVNVARDHQRSGWYRRSKQFAGEDSMLHGKDIEAQSKFEHKEELDLVRKGIMFLRQDEKEVFLLRQNGELTFEQIAEIRRTPIGTVKTQMRSAVHKLRQRLA